MHHVRRWLALGVALMFLTAGAASSSLAQQATPEAGGAALGPVAEPNGTLPDNPQVQLVKVAGGLADPVNVASANDGSGRLFIVERIGRIRIIDKDGKLLPDPFLDIQSLVKTDFLEQGLLGLAFSPDYKTNGLFYVDYVDYLTNGDVVIAEFHVSKDDPNKADPDSERILLTQDKPFVNHNGGTLRFGPDKMLYASIGDGGLAGDPYDNAQRVDVLLGKLLRIDPNARDAGAYGIPKTNPFANTGVVLPSNQAGQMAQDGSYHPAARREICDWGLRNPWQFSFDKSTGDLYVADVGQNTWEEVNYFPADEVCGWNMGWDHNEGAHCYPPDVQSCDKLGALPVANYNHSSGDCSITGIGVYRGTESPALDGIYFNSDFCSGTLYGLVLGANRTWIYAPVLKTSLKSTGSGQDENGELYLTACSCKYSRDYNALADPQGTVWRIVSADKVPQGAELAPGSAAATPVAAAPTVAPTTSAGGQQASNTQVTIKLEDIKFDPAEVTIPANTDVTITLQNTGFSAHSFNIDANHNPSNPNIHSGTVAPGTTVTIKVKLAPGDWYYYCDVPGHEAAGMHGVIHAK